jgi:hypothetical protein
MWKDLLVLVAMVLSGAVTLLLTGLVLVSLGLRFHGNYEHYGINYPLLIWGPAVIAFLAPGVVVWYVSRKKE